MRVVEVVVQQSPKTSSENNNINIDHTYTRRHHEQPRSTGQRQARTPLVAPSPWPAWRQELRPGLDDGWWRIDFDWPHLPTSAVIQRRSIHVDL